MITPRPWRTLVAAVFVPLLACSSVGRPIGDAPPGSDADADAGGDADADADADSDGDGDGDGDVDADADGDSDGDADVGVDAGPDRLWVEVPAGTFVMGSPLTEEGRCGDATGSNPPGEDQHEVTLTRSFEIQATEVTQAQFLRLMGYDPSYFAGCPECPVEQLTWSEAAAYCNARSNAAGLPTCYLCIGSGSSTDCQHDPTFATCYDCPGYRLPTEAEWEYAARAGTTSATYNGELESEPDDCVTAALEPIAWYCGNAGETTHPVASLRPNAWGLYDMLGNVGEFTNDSDGYLLGRDPVTDPWRETRWGSVIRGGGYMDYDRLRAASRSGHCTVLTDRADECGFRPARTLP